MTTDMMIEASVLSTLRPPRGSITILISFLGMAAGMRAAFLIVAATRFAKLALSLGLGCWSDVARGSSRR